MKTLLYILEDLNPRVFSNMNRAKKYLAPPKINIQPMLLKPPMMLKTRAIPQYMLKKI